jgi:hypothetical protein
MFTSTTSPLGFEIGFFYIIIKIKNSFTLSYILIVPNSSKKLF